MRCILCKSSWLPEKSRISYESFDNSHQKLTWVGAFWLTIIDLMKNNIYTFDTLCLILSHNFEFCVWIFVYTFALIIRDHQFHKRLAFSPMNNWNLWLVTRAIPHCVCTSEQHVCLSLQFGIQNISASVSVNTKYVYKNHYSATDIEKKISTKKKIDCQVEMSHWIWSVMKPITTRLPSNILHSIHNPLFISFSEPVFVLSFFFLFLLY